MVFKIIFKVGIFFNVVNLFINRKLFNRLNGIESNMDNGRM